MLLFENNERDNVMRLISLLLVAIAGIAGTSHAVLPTPVTQTTTSPIISITPTTPLQTLMPAPQKQELASKIFAYLVQNQNGQETLIPITPSTPVVIGSVVEYQGFFDNVSNQRIRLATVSLDIPMGLELIGVSGDNIFASVDGQRYARMPLRTQLNGQISEIPLSYYRGLRWQVGDIGLAGTVMVKYRARVL